MLRPHIEIMYRMAYRWVGSEHDAEDIVQDVLIKLVDRVAEMEALEQLRPWLIKCVYRRFIDVHRSQSRSPVHSESSFATPESDESFSDAHADYRDEITQMIDGEALNEALQILDDKHRDIILLHDAEGYSASEVADITGESIGTVKSRLHRARNKLKKFIIDGTF